MSDIKLSHFCGEPHRKLDAPMTHGDWTYACDGYACIRVPRRDLLIYDNPGMTERLEKWLDAVAASETRPLPKLNIPVPDRTLCFKCDGTGREHSDCDCCDHPCEECDDGYVEKTIAVRLHGLTMNAKLLLRFAALPNIEMGTKLTEHGHIPFKFDGGVGCLMPMREGDAVDLDAEVEKVLA